MSELPEELPTAGPIAGKYELVRLIGRGGMGAVWEGRHASLGTRVAIKFIDTEYAESQEARTRFDNEARAAATIQSKHAIQIYDHGVTGDGKPYIVMELLVGEPLDARVDRLTRLPLGDTTHILRQVARALARAHEKGIVHRDLKPENIFLVRTPDDDDEIAKVLDFGIAKFKMVDGQNVSGGGVSSSTKTGAVIGTPFYMSPEQARGLREIDHRSDLWSMGVIAFKCVCGVLPFEGVSVGDLLVKVCTAPAPAPSSIVPGLSPAFDAWFARTVEKDPSRRFQSAGELADALALAAGVSVKRPASLTPTSDPLAAANATSVPPRGIEPTLPNVTSAPFTSPARTSSSPRGVIAAAIGATVVGAALGAFGILRMSPGGSSSAHGSAQNGTTAALNAPPAMPPPVDLAALDAGATADLLPAPALPPAHHPALHAPKPSASPPLPPIPSVAQASPRGATILPSAALSSPLPHASTPPVPKPVPNAKPSANVMDPGY
jgi:serine/threonine-protein kinase